MARPSFKPTAVQRTAVAVAAAGGMAHEEVAMALGISRNTLEKHFETELSTGAHKRRLTWLLAMDKAARSGNVAAQKALLATSPALAIPPAPAETKPPKLGKKDQAQADASTAEKGTEWGGLLPKHPLTLQ